MKKGLKANLPTSADDNVLLFTNDSGELFKGNGNGNPLIKYSDVAYFTSLPVSGEVGKIYIIEESVGVLKLYSYANGNWINFSSGELDTDTLNMLLGLESKVDTFGYDNDGNIISVSTVYVNNKLEDENTSYTYDLNGNITKEEILKLGKKITNLFTYDSNDNVTKIETIVVDV